jgi:hypothetical protein
MIHVKRCAKRGCDGQAGKSVPYCKIHHAEYMRNWRFHNRQSLIIRGYCLGIDALRRVLMSEFRRQGLNEINGVTAGEICRIAVVPNFNATINEIRPGGNGVNPYPSAGLSPQ